MWNNQKQKKNVFHYVKLANLLSFKLDFQKVDQHTGGQVVNPRHQIPQEQSVANPGKKRDISYYAIRLSELKLTPESRKLLFVNHISIHAKYVVYTLFSDQWWNRPDILNNIFSR